MVLPAVVGAAAGTIRGGVGLLVVLLGVVEVAGGTTRGWWGAAGGTNRGGGWLLVVLLGVVGSCRWYY